jgi:hypothetical protein
MRKLVFVFLFSLLARDAFSQQLHFIYIQTDSHRPFYVRMGTKLISSSAAGYLIIPRLIDSSYELVLGFPKDSGPEWVFNCRVKGKDIGFDFKDMGEKGWGLFNPQTMELLMGSRMEARNKTTERTSTRSGATVSNDPFSSLLAAAVSDSTIMETPVVVITKKPPSQEIEALAAKPKIDSTQIVVNVEKKIRDTLASTNQADSLAERSLAQEKSVQSGLSTKGEQPQEPELKDHFAKLNKDNNLASHAAKAKREGQDENLKLITPPAKYNADSLLAVAAVGKSDPKQARNDMYLRTKEKGDSMSSVMAAGEKKPAIQNIDSGNNKIAVNKKTNEPATNEKVQIPGANVMTEGSGREDGKNMVNKSKGRGSPISPEVKSNSLSEITTSIKKTLDRQSIEGTELIYIDEISSGRKDTVRILIPAEKGNASVKNPVLSANGSPKYLDLAISPRQDGKPTQETGKKEEKAESIRIPDSQVAPRTAEPTEAVGFQSGAVNPNCKAIAENDDLDQTRRKMIMKVDEDDMILVALKAFKLKCYTTEQVKNLSFIFLRDPGKYKLFDAAFPFVYDPVNFPQLEKQLSDTYYVNRFKALVQK